MSAANNLHEQSSAAVDAGVGDTVIIVLAVTPRDPLEVSVVGAELGTPVGTSVGAGLGAAGGSTSSISISMHMPLEQ